MESSSDSTASECSSSAVPSLLSKLKCPTASDLARKRRVASNPPTGLKRSKGKTVADPKTVVPSERVKQYPEENLKVSHNNLFCDACREPLSLKKSVIELHTCIKSVKHKNGKARLASKEKRERAIADMLQQYDHDGEGLPASVRVYRVRAVTAFLQSGVALNKLDCFRELLEENGLSLSSSQHLRELIPLVLREERRKIKEQIHDRQVSVIFGCTTHVAEAMVIVLRYVDDQWNIHQRVVR